MPWIINATGLIEVKHLSGQTPGGKIRVTTNRRIIDPVSGGYSETENIYAGNPPQLIAIITINDSFSGVTRNRTQLTRAPASTVIPGAIGGFIPAEEIVEIYEYRGAGAIACIGDILGKTLQEVRNTIRRPLGSYADYIKYLRDRGQNPNPAPFVVVSQTVRLFEYDSKGRTSKITESTLEDPRALAGLVKGIDWTTTVVSGLAETKRRIQTWTELRLNDWQYRNQEYDAWCRSAPNSIPPGTPLLRQIEPVLVKSEVSVSTSQNQPPAAERAPADFVESSRNEKEILYFSDPAAPFSPKETVYTFDLLSAGSGGLSIGGVSLWDLGTIAGQHEYGRANQIEIVQDVTDEWFDYRPYQPIRIDEPGESGIYAIAGATFAFTQNEFKVGTRGLLVGTIDQTNVVQPPYSTPPRLIDASFISPSGSFSAVIGSPVGIDAGYLVSPKGSFTAEIGTGSLPNNIDANFVSPPGSFSAVIGRVGVINANLVSPLGSFTAVINQDPVTAFLTATGITDSTQITALNYLVSELQLAGLWNRMTAVYPIIGGTAATHKFNLVDARDTDSAFRLLGLNTGWTHAATGMTPSSAFADTRLQPSTVLQPLSHHLAFYSRTNNVPPGSDSIDMGSVSNGTSQLLISALATATKNRVHGAADATRRSVNNADARGFFGVSRESSTVLNLIKKSPIGTVFGVSFSTSGTLPTQNIWIGARDDGTGSPDANTFTNQEYAYASIGENLTLAEWDTCYAIVQQYQTLLGRQV